MLTGYGRGEQEFLATSNVQPDFVAADLAEAVDWILADVDTGAAEERTPLQG